MEEKELKELQKKVADYEATQDKVVELEATIKELKKVDVDAIVTEQSRKDAKVIADLEKRIKELEDEPVKSLSDASDIDDTYAGLTFSGNEGIHRRV